MGMTVSRLARRSGRVHIYFVSTFDVGARTRFCHVFTQRIVSYTTSALRGELRSIGRFLGTISPDVALGDSPASALSFSLGLRLRRGDIVRVLRLPRGVTTTGNVRLVIYVSRFRRLTLLPNCGDVRKGVHST